MNAQGGTALAETRSGPVIDTDFFLTTFGSDRSACEELVDLFQRISDQQMRELDQARAVGDWDRVANEAHSLKGSLGIFGARAAIRLLDTLELACEADECGRILACLAALEVEMASVQAEVARLRSN
jgi:two-component system, sensor histidine kinase and response regulator